MNSTLPREGLRPRARRLLGRLAAVLVVASLGFGPSPALADEADAGPSPRASVQMHLAVAPDTLTAPAGGVLGTVAIDNQADSDLSAGSVVLEVNTTPLADGAALDAWLDAGTIDGGFRTVATESTPVVADGAREAVSVAADAAELGALAPGVYAVKARLSGASTSDEDGQSVPWNVTAISVLVIAPPTDARVAVIVPVTATPENGSLLTRDELAALTDDRGALDDVLEAVKGTSAILAIDPAIPAAIRVLGASAPAQASQWLESIEALPNDVFTLQFADADATVQSQAGLTELLAAPDLTPLLDPADFPATTPTPGPTSPPTPTPIPTPSPLLPDADDLSAIRGADTGMLWPRAGVTEADLAAFSGFLGDDAVTVLPSSAVQGDAAVHSTAGAHELLVTDAAASARLSTAVETTDPVAIDGELAAVAGHLFFSAQRHPLSAIALNRSETRSPQALREALVAFATPGVSLGALRSGEPASVSLTESATGSRVAELNSMLADEQRLAAFATILDQPAVLLAPARIRVLRTIGAGVTDEQFAKRSRALADRVTTTLSSVSVQKPKPVQLFTSAAPLPVWVRNDLPWPVTVTLFSTPSDTRLDIQRATTVSALASTATRVDVPIEARVASGQVDVRFRLESASGVQIGQPEVADVTLRADWEGIGLGILGGVIALLLIVGIVRMVRRRRADAGQQTPEEQQ